MSEKDFPQAWTDRGTSSSLRFYDQLGALAVRKRNHSAQSNTGIWWRERDVCLVLARLCRHAVVFRSFTVWKHFFPRTHWPLHHTSPCGEHLSRAGVGKGCGVHRADLKWLKSSSQGLFCVFHIDWGKPSWNYFLFTEGRVWGEKEKAWSEWRKMSSETPDCNVFQVETGSWTIRGEMASLVNSGPPRTHLRWRLIPLCAREEALSPAVISGSSLNSSKFLLDHSNHKKISVN